MLFTFGQSGRNFFSRLFPSKLSMCRLRFATADSSGLLTLARSVELLVATPGTGSAIGSGMQESSWRTAKRKKPTMPNDSHQRAAEFHELAAHAHRAAAVHHGKEDHQTGHEHSKQAMEYANKAMEWTQEAHRKSARAAGKA
jgi:hypothetical protein